MSATARRPRVLFLQHAVYPYRRPLFDALHEHTDLTVVFCVAAKKFRRWSTDPMFVDVPFKARVLPSLKLGKLVINPTLAREIRRDRFDAIIFGGVDLITLPQVLVLLALARSRRIPLIACEEFFPTAWYMRTRPVGARLAIALRRAVHRRCSAFVAWNPNARDHLVVSGARPERVFYGPHWYPEPPIERMAPTSTGRGRRTILVLSYLLPRKGIDVAIRAVRSLPHQDVELVIAGDGEEAEALRAAAAGDDRIVFAGHLDEAAKEEAFRKAYVFVLPTLWDPWGLVVNEALYRALPVIVTDAAGCARVLVDGNGFIIRAGDERALATRLAYFLDHPDERDRMAAHSPAVAARCTMDAMLAPVLASLRHVRALPA